MHKGDAEAVYVVEDLTPNLLRCSVGGCPAVMKLSDGDLLVIGKHLSPELLEQVKDRIADDEFAVKLSIEYFRALSK